MRSDILIVEDDPTVSTIMAGYLESEGFKAEVAATATEMLDLVSRRSFSLVILDLGLPDEDGLALLRKLRARTSMPAMVVSARNSIETRLAAFELGAADILGKPFDPRELRFRVLNLIGRQDRQRSPVTEQQLGDWDINLALRTVQCRATQRRAELTRVEFDLLVLLVGGQGRVFSRAQIIDGITGAATPESDRAVDTLISRLRRKLSKTPGDKPLIVTVRGIGYRADLR